jgi:hypothetical protein
MAERRFNEKQTAEILRLAVQGQSESGLTSESELRAAAQEMGISPEAISRAIDKTESQAGTEKPSWFWGGPMAVAIDDVVEGELTTDIWEDTIINLRKTLGEEGTINERGNVREWTAIGGGLVPVTVSIRQLNGTVRLDISSRLDGVAVMFGIIGTFLLIMGLALSGKFGAATALGAPALMIIVTATIAAATRFFFSRSSNAHEKSIRLLAKRLRTRLAENNAQTAQQPQQAEPDESVRA